MSTTFIGIHLDGNKMTFVSVGDSLLLRYRDEEIHRVNLDHSYADVLDRRLLGVGSADPREWSVAINDDQRAAITLALSGGPLDRDEYGHRPQVAKRDLLPGDVVIAASDGIETIELVQLQNFLRQLAPKGAGGIAEGLIKAADGIGPNRRREPDNTTIVIIQVPGSTGIIGPRRHPRCDDGPSPRFRRRQRRQPTGSRCSRAHDLAVEHPHPPDFHRPWQSERWPQSCCC